MVNYQNIKRYYDKQYSKHQNDTFPFDQKRFDQLLKDIPAPIGSNPKLLDIGCGSGQLCQMMHSYGYHVFGIDISQEAIRLAKANVPTGNFSAANDSSQLDFDNEEFDIITCMGVLEHTINPEHLLGQIHRILKKGGTALILVPNQWNPYFWFGGTWQIYEKPRPKSAWNRLFLNCNFDIKSIRKDPGPTIHHGDSLIKKLKIWALKAINTLPNDFAYQLNYTLQK